MELYGRLVEQESKILERLCRKTAKSLLKYGLNPNYVRKSGMISVPKEWSETQKNLANVLPI